MDRGQLITVVCVVIIGAGAALPWLTINVLGQVSLALIDVYGALAQSLGLPFGGLSGAAAAYGQIVTGFESSPELVASLVLYPAALVLGVLSILFRRLRIPAGGVAVVSGASWIYGLSLLAGSIAQAAQATGVPGNQTAGPLTAVVSVGYGPYVVMFGGAILAVLSAVAGHRTTPAAKEHGEKEAGRGGGKPSKFLKDRVKPMLKKLGATRIDVVESEGASAVLSVTSHSGKTLVFSDYRTGNAPVTPADVDSFAQVVKDEMSRQGVTKGIYVTNGSFAPGCAGAAQVTLVDGRRLDSLLAKK